MDRSFEIALVPDGPLRWRIPRAGPMRTDGVIYATPEMIAALGEDQSPRQVANVACLPGIVGNSLAMPDFHWGYGFPIGGVAAFDAEAGVVSPGGIGYDINCLTGEARVLHRWGFHLPIRDVRSGRADVRCLDLDGAEPSHGRVINFRRPLAKRPVVLLRTAGGFELRATDDHPMLTPGGFRETRALRPGDRVAVHPFEGVPYEPPPELVLVDEAKIRRLLTRIGKTGGRAADQIVRSLARRGLLPLRADHPAVPPLLGLLGLVTGDGSLHFVGKTGKGRTAITGHAEDLEQLRRDLAPWFRVSRVYHRRRAHVIETAYGRRSFEATESFVHINSSAAAILLHALGCPLGPRTTAAFRAPSYLRRAPRWHVRLYLAALFGAELSSPRTATGHDTCFDAPALTQVKRQGAARGGRAFLREIGRLCRRFDVETRPIEERPEAPRRGVPSLRQRLVFDATGENLRALYERIGFTYQRKRAARAAAAALYLRHRQAEVARRTRALARIAELRSAGIALSRIVAQMAPDGINRRFVERSIYGRATRLPRVSRRFQRFAAFATDRARGLGASGAVWDEVASIEPALSEEVFDITVDHRDHNFVASGLVVHNCGVRLLASELRVDEVRPRLAELADALYARIPSGVGSKRKDLRVVGRDLDGVLRKGARWVVERGLGEADDLARLEEAGCLAGADPSAVTERARERGASQLGTLGSGNHFCEVGFVAEVHAEAAARAFGLQAGA
ncbi:MAG: RtcB family protein, partial [Myxococcota bacterium]